MEVEGPQREALSHLTALKSIIETAPSYLDLSVVKRSYNEANEAYKQAQYEDASIIAKGAVKGVMDYRNRYIETLKHIKDAESALGSGASKYPHRVNDPQRRITRAKQVLMEGRFTTASALAASAVVLMEGGNLSSDPLGEDANESLEEVLRKVKGIPDFMVSPELRLLIQQANSSIQGKNYLDSLETIHLIGQRVSQLKKDAGSLIDDLAQLEKRFHTDLAQGQLSHPQAIAGMLNEIRAAMGRQEMDPAKYHLQRCRRELEVQREYVLGPLRQKAMASLTPLADLIAQEKEEGVDTTDAQDIFEDASAEMDNADSKEDYEKVIRLTHSAENALKRARLRHQRIGGELRESQGLLRTAEDTMSKIAEYVRITPQIESFVEELRELLDGSDIKGFRSTYSALSEEVDRIQKESDPHFILKTKLESHHPNEWMKAVMVLSNTGDASASDISITISGPLQVHKIDRVPSLPYDQKTAMEVGIKFLDEGNVPFDIHLEYSRSLDGNRYSQDIQQWMTIGEAVPTVITPPIQIDASGRIADFPMDVQEERSSDEDLFEFELDDDQEDGVDIDEVCDEVKDKDEGEVAEQGDDRGETEIDEEGDDELEGEGEIGSEDEGDDEFEDDGEYDIDDETEGKKLIQVVTEEDIIEKIERLGVLLKMGLLTTEEFLEKKRELLARL